MLLIRRRKLTQNQTRRIQKNSQITSCDDSALFGGVIISHFGKQLDVRLTTLPSTRSDILSLGDVCRCHARTNLPLLTAGDDVLFDFDHAANLGRIEKLVPRRTLITRPDRYHKVKPVAANVARLVIVFAPVPKPASGLIDRYLVMAAHAGIWPLLVLNKADLARPDDESVILFQEYQKLGIEALMVSATTGMGLDALYARLLGCLSVFAGQSGVGKSSIINTLLPHAEQATNIISYGSQLGQHTTTTSRLFSYDDDLGKGGVIDTPGIREYGVWHLNRDDITQGFDDVAAFVGHCQFCDCKHSEYAKGCALWQAVASDKLLARRVLSYTELLAESVGGAF